LIQALALVEAGIDFSDEADVPADLIHPALAVARELHDEISTVLAQAGRGERLRDGLVVAIAGPPNAGKSTLLNRIARRDAAIVSPFAGTTRDVIEVHLDLAGYPVTLLDTAGMRETADPVEQEGVRRARDRAAAADLVLWVTEAGHPMTELPGFAGDDGGGGRPMAGAADSAVGAGSMADKQAAARVTGLDAGLETRPMAEPPPVWVIQNKIDLMEQISEYEIKNENIFISISAEKGAGVEELLARLESHAEQFFGHESALISRERHRLHLVAAQSALARALAESPSRQEIVAEELRLASRALGRLTGKIDVEDILDAIFRDFCIGK
jgi:tRNA modification GTPase